MLQQIMGPSVTKMKKHLKIPHEDAYLVKLIMEGKVDPKHVEGSPPNYPEYVRQLYAINKIIGGNGLGWIVDKYNVRISEYIDNKEKETIIYDKKKRRYFLESYSSYVERKRNVGIMD